MEPLHHVAVLDEDALQQVREEAPTLTLSDLAGTFLSEAETRCQRIADAVQNQDAARAEYEAHTLSGTSGTFGAMRLQAMAIAMEVSCRDGGLTKVAEDLPALRSTLEEARRAFQDYVKSH